MSRIRVTIYADEAMWLTYGSQRALEGIRLEPDGTITGPPEGLSTLMTPRPVVGSWEHEARDA